MTLLDFLGIRSGNEVASTSVLACGLGSKFDGLLEADSTVYSVFYRRMTMKKFSTVRELLESISQGYDIVHLFCNVSADGLIVGPRGTSIIGTSLIEQCTKADVKLLWVASENKPEGYIKGFKAARINLVMTINRNGTGFSAFLKKLLSRLCQGETMPRAWASLAPQAPGP